MFRTKGAKEEIFPHFSLRLGVFFVFHSRMGIQYLQIHNLALLEKASLELDSGFTVVTGETGAGKSVLLGALSILCGNRIDKAVIRQGSDYCSVEGLFHFNNCEFINTLLENHGLPACDEGELVIKRRINRKRSPQIHVNGALTPFKVLQEIGEYWIDFHGPGEPQKLFIEKYQLGMLDAFAGTKSAFTTYNQDYREWQQLRAKYESVQNTEKLSEDEADYIRSQIASIDAVNPTHESIEKLERDHLRINRSQEISSHISELMNGFQSGQGLTNRARALMKTGEDLADIIPEALEPSKRLESLIIEIDDLAACYATLADSIDTHPGAVEEIQQRMQAWMELRRKFGQDVSSILEKRRQLEERLQSQGNIEETLSQINQQIIEVEKRLREQAAKLYRKRLSAAKTLQKEVTERLLKLGFKKAIFAIEVIDDQSISISGGSHCCFQFAPNLGHSLQPLNKIASSGETARVMLAIKTVLAKVETTPVLVFDEVDANIGGEIGAEVGRELANLADNHQVFCITHLPQVAAYGQQHFLVAKTYANDQTLVQIQHIHDQQELRTNEIARMLGNRNSDSAKQHAEELLSLSLLGE